MNSSRDVGECIIVDSDDELPGHVQIIGRLGPETGSDPLLSSMVVFKVVHARPGRLKRPLHAEDDVGPNDIAFRKYSVLERDMSQDVLRIRVMRTQNSDVFLCFH